MHSWAYTGSAVCGPPQSVAFLYSWSDNFGSQIVGAVFWLHGRQGALSGGLACVQHLACKSHGLLSIWAGAARGGKE
eukprot:1849778-Pyramimonas_sp.AAC.1